ncbi:hypothetical protein EG329_001721 [Mollisiaceae sp. DMI_Dod_QoI]|nr:hypothetical protein EG329_001721 [Helotiales sp. DMI_Dod_QoI]
MPEYNINTLGNTIVTTFPTQVSNRTFLITGPSQGSVGAETALTLAHGSPSTLILLGRDLSKIQPVITSISTINPSINIKYIPIDLSSFASVRSAAKSILDDTSIPKIDIMINNAAVMAAPYKVTEDGFESHFQINHLSHFLLTNLLMPKLLLPSSSSDDDDSQSARILNISSSAHQISDIRYGDIDFGAGKEYVPWLAYGQSKTANLLFTVELNRRFKGKGCGVWSFAPTPGAVDSGLQRYVTKEMREQGERAWKEAGKELPVRKR